MLRQGRRHHVLNRQGCKRKRGKGRTCIRIGAKKSPGESWRIRKKGGGIMSDRRLHGAGRE